MHLYRKNRSRVFIFFQKDHPVYSRNYTKLLIVITVFPTQINNYSAVRNFPIIIHRQLCVHSKLFTIVANKIEYQVFISINLFSKINAF